MEKEIEQHFLLLTNQVNSLKFNQPGFHRTFPGGTRRFIPRGWRHYGVMERV